MLTAGNPAIMLYAIPCGICTMPIVNPAKISLNKSFLSYLTIHLQKGSRSKKYSVKQYLFFKCNLSLVEVSYFKHLLM